MHTDADSLPVETGPKLTWLDLAQICTAAATKAKAAGDMVAFVDLIVHAAGCVKIARNLATADECRRRIEQRGPHHG